MFPTQRLILLFGTLAGCLLLAGAALAQPSGVKDGAKLFKPETIKQANEQIELMQRRFQVELVIETVPQLTNGQVEVFKKLKDAPSRERFLRERAEEQAREAGARGICVWICKSPPRLEVVVGPDVTEEILPVKYRKEPWDRLARRIDSDKRRDEELLGAIRNLQDRLEYARRPVVWPWVLGLVAAVLGVWVVIGLLRLRRRDPSSDVPGGVYIHQPASGNKEAPTTGAAGPTGENSDSAGFPEEKSELTRADEPQQSDYHASGDDRLD